MEATIILQACGDLEQVGEARIDMGFSRVVSAGQRISCVTSWLCYRVFPLVVDHLEFHAAHECDWVGHFSIMEFPYRPRRQVDEE